MACSRFEYVKTFEHDPPILPNCWFTARHGFEKPNDPRGLALMTRAAAAVVNKFNEIVLAFGESDEYSFLFRRDTTLWGRRMSKILTSVVSLFTAAYVFSWNDVFGRPRDGSDGGECGADESGAEGSRLQCCPSFDGRVVCYPSEQNVRDYFSWRQADCHVNNQYNTCFWSLVKAGESREQAYETLKGTHTAAKNELLYQRFGINYAKLPAIYRKGTIIIRDPAGRSGRRREQRTAQADGGCHEKDPPASAAATNGPPEEPSGGDEDAGRDKATYPGLWVLHEDLIGDRFWEAFPHILDPPAGKAAAKNKT
ncbi:unnamed protein product [Vitrella brassicaformis CCMP3155]|uniref:tRNA(His) guanylyltransferase n=1 Tax=Vitrella brassicaformis (strain CCMP3155) TaxID=1169540 RepID=A0A0G4FUW7_VITBC|nr:unnamed protein product [Vitrella brassicaformis CCMP3155]|eukprot:CEM18517.1 unnamed protein product [Vitrella brassicaformis CCMP3155]